jgi:hypothetical protein
MRAYLIFFAALILAGIPVAQCAPWATFVNTSQTLTLATPLCSLTLNASTGTFITLRDLSFPDPLFYGSAFGQLWSLVGPRGSLSNTASDLAFGFSFSQDTGTLQLTWKSSTSGVSIAVSIAAPAQQRYLDLTFSLLTPPQGPADGAFDSLWFPSNFLFNSTGANVFYPQLPGLILNQSFFSAGTASNMPYPGSGTFAEFLHVNTTAHATVSMFTVSGPNLTIPHFKGLFPTLAAGSGLWRYAHSIQPINVTNGCDVMNNGWVPGGGVKRGAGSGDAAPPCALGLDGTVTVRLALRGSILQDMGLYSDANSLSLPPVATKMPLPLLQKLARAPLIKVDAIGVGLPFSQYASKLLPIFTRPGLMHYVAFEPVAFDHWYPDFLPPAERFGSNCDALSAWEAAKAQGHLVMPYTNPTWWDPVAPTLATSLPAAGLKLTDVTTLNASGLPVWETYPDVPPASGVVTSLAHPFVVARWKSLMCQLQGGPQCPPPTSCNDTALGSDLMFEDQLGARNSLADTSLSQGGMGALGWQDNIQRHAQNFSGVLLGTEQGYDRLAPHVYGFFGNNIEVALATKAGWPWFGANFTPYPASQALFGPSLLYHIHNLETGVFANSIGLACWAMATGARLSIDGSALYWAGPPARAFAAAVAVLQSVVVSQWTGYGLSAYEDLMVGGVSQAVGLGATRSDFTAPPALSAAPIFPSASPRYSIWRNWANEDSLAVSAPGGLLAAAVLPPLGCMAVGSALDVIGGFYTSYNGKVLPGPLPHAITEDRGCTAYGPAAVCVYHGVGVDTMLSVLAPAAAPPSPCKQPTCTARDINGTAIAGVACTLEGAAPTLFVTFPANASLGGKAVDFVSIVCAAAP